MRAVIQRVSEACVTVDQKQSAAIGRGLLVFLAAGQGDTEKQAIWMARKIIGLRVFADDAGKMNRALAEVGGSMVVVSQFTLYGDCRKGHRPSFVFALEPKEAERLCTVFVEEIHKAGIPCGTGVFGAHMRVSLVNDGPVTLLLDSSLPRNAGEKGFSGSPRLCGLP